MARRKSGRPISGVVLLDKPTGITSNAALQQVRRFLMLKKLATPVLSTRLQQVCCRYVWAKQLSSLIIY